MVLLRRLHLIVGFALVPLVVVQALTGLLLRLRLAGEVLHAVHTWFKYRFDFAQALRTAGQVIGAVAALGLLFLALSGATVYLDTRVRQARRRRRQVSGHPSPPGPVRG